MQGVPQAPQLWLLVCVFTHAPPQLVVPIGQAATQAPAEQASPAAQALPQPPQLRTSLDVVVQTPLHRVSPPGHTQLPALQVWPPLQ